MEKRVIDLEIRVTHQEAVLETLNRVVVEQQQAIDQLRAQHGRLMELVRELAPSPVTPASEEPPPPHY
ncbi:MAG: hypothetical protein B7Z66_03285 [Chromatiales bacterium 21-64-14]|nr:MAG: hypothetical protein B7Z66_03285 [Chromatiales bacterium 21-64-14]HQU15838.1 SlyX family protein [Gammaproteobacteria bacterium]